MRNVESKLMDVAARRNNVYKTSRTEIDKRWNLLRLIH